MTEEIIGPVGEHNGIVTRSMACVLVLPPCQNGDQESTVNVSLNPNQFP